MCDATCQQVLFSMVCLVGIGAVIYGAFYLIRTVRELKRDKERREADK